MNHPSFWLIAPAAGIGQRMQAGLPKQYLRLGQRYLLDITLSRVLDRQRFAGCVVPIHAEDRWWPGTESAADARIVTCAGGGERADSVLAGLDALSGLAAEDDWVLVHDVARPCLHPSDLDRLLDELRDDPVGGILAAPVTDTLKQARPGSGRIESSPDRRRVWRALTPQMFRYGLLRRCLRNALASGQSVTDESSALEFAGYQPRLVEGRSDNLKVTVPEDLVLAAFIIDQHDRERSNHPESSSQ